MEIVERTALRHNPANAVTQVVEEVRLADGRVLVHKRLGRDNDGAPEHWRAGDDPADWNYWRREADAYLSDALHDSLRGTGLTMPDAEVVEEPDRITLWLERVEGTHGTVFDLDDHVALARSLGRWQARPVLDEPWCSRGFLRAYSTSKPVPWELLDDDAAWAQPLVDGVWPADVRAGWSRLLGARERLLAIMEALPRVPSHLDCWVSNELRRADGTFALVDWSFCGDGALGEDLGNHVPDAVFDLFWPGERIDELDSAMFASYVGGLREAGWRGDERVARLGVTASCVKYTWLLPLMLADAGNPDQQAYHEPVDGEHKFRERGLGVVLLVRWCDEALALAEKLGVPR